MRNFFDMSDPTSERGAGPVAPLFERRLVKIVTLGFWTPCCAADLWLLHRGEQSVGEVFWLVFREALVFLAVWFAAAATRGLLQGSQAPPELDARQHGKLRVRLADGFRGYRAPTRSNRGQ